MAVTFFFILGGFSMTLGYRDKVAKPDFSYMQYLTRRCIKFYPLHWLCLILAIPFTIAIFKWSHIPVFMVNAGLMHTLLPFEKLNFSYNTVSWYLADTMFFAVVCPFVLRFLLKSSKITRRLIAVGFVVLYTAIAIVIPTELYHMVLYVSPYVRLADFILGIYLALVYLQYKEQIEKRIKLTNNTMAVFVLILIALLVFQSCVLSKEIRFIAPVFWPLVAAIVLLTSLSERAGGGKIYLKTCSYSVSAN